MKLVYLPYAIRYKFATECIEAITAPIETQIIMLEWLLEDSEDVDNGETAEEG